MLKTVTDILEREGKKILSFEEQKAIREQFESLPSNPTMDDLASLYLTNRLRKELAEIEFDKKKKIERACEIALLEKMREQGTKQFRRTNGELLSKRDNLYAHIKDKDGVINWAIENQGVAEGLVEMKVVNSVANDLCKKHLLGELGVALPEDLIGYWIKESISYRKPTRDPREALDHMEAGGK